MNTFLTSVKLMIAMYICIVILSILSIRQSFRIEKIEKSSETIIEYIDFSKELYDGVVKYNNSVIEYNKKIDVIQKKQLKQQEM